MLSIKVDANSQGPLFLARVPCEAFREPFGVIRVASESARWYFRYAQDPSIKDSCVLPFWVGAFLGEDITGVCFDVSKVSDAHNVLEPIKHASFHFIDNTPPPCSLETVTGAVRDQLRGHLLFPKAIIPVVIYGRLLFLEAGCEAEVSLGFIDVNTTILFPGLGGPMITSVAVSPGLPPHLYSLHRSIDRGDCPFPDNVIIVETDDREEARAFLGGQHIYEPPLQLLLNQPELMTDPALDQAKLMELARWGAELTSGIKDAPVTIHLDCIALMSLKTVRIISRIWETEWRSLPLVVVMNATGERALLLQKIFKNASIISINPQSRLMPPKKVFQITLLIDKLGMNREEALSRVERDLRLTPGEGSLSLLLSSNSGSWNRIHGYETTKARIKMLLDIFCSKAERLKCLGLSPLKGMLLHGPPGCGKSEMVKAIAGDGVLPVIRLRPTDILSRYLGESEARLRQVFSQAREMRPAILFIDNIELLGARRQLGSADTTGVSERLLSTLLNEMDGIIDSTGILVIGCTHQIQMLDDALIRPGRLDHHIEVSLPSAADIEHMLRAFLGHLHIAYTEADLLKLVGLLTGLTPAQIKAQIYSYAASHLRSLLPLSVVPLIEDLEKGK